MKVVIPSPLLSYTGGREVDASGATLAEILADLDRRYPGFRFRMIDEQDHLRPHMRMFVNGRPSRDLSTVLSPSDEVQIVQALSGG
ncbi:MAG TPA: MoaD/ThiS family protein [Planctomycetota bacterium]|nr:MoaD/ThiS family protein [Planctomycetota bacterium]